MNFSSLKPLAPEQFGPIEYMIIGFLLLGLGLFGYGMSLQNNIQRLSAQNGKLKKLKNDLEQVQKGRSKLQYLRNRDANPDVRQNALQNLRKTLQSVMKKTNISDPETVLGQQQNLPERKLPDRNLIRRGSQFTLQNLSLNHLVQILYLLETNFPSLKTRDINLENFELPGRVIQEANITLVYYEPEK